MCQTCSMKRSPFRACLHPTLTMHHAKQTLLLKSERTHDAALIITLHDSSCIAALSQCNSSTRMHAEELNRAMRLTHSD